MSPTNHRTQQTLLAIMLVIMVLPLVGSFVPATRGKPLFGVETTPMKRPSLWRILDHTWQQKAEEAIKQQLGFSNHGVRLINDLNYRCFHYSNAPKLVIGRHDYFFEDIYLDEYMGKDFVGEDTIQSNIFKLKQLQEYFHQQGQELLLILAPGKARYMPEELPTYVFKGVHTNYDSYVRELHRQGVDYLDLNAYFSTLKKHSEHPLFSRHGIHWTTYGMWVAADTLQRYIEQRTGMTLPDIVQVGDTLSNAKVDLDFDLEPPMNLLCPLRHETLYFPIMQFMLPTAPRAEALLIADSYAWSLWDHGILQHWFAQTDYWYYNYAVYPNIWEPNICRVQPEQLIPTLQRKDVVILLMTDANLRNFGWDFLDQVSEQLLAQP